MSVSSLRMASSSSSISSRCVSPLNESNDKVKYDLCLSDGTSVIRCTNFWKMQTLSDRINILLMQETNLIKNCHCEIRHNLSGSGSPNTRVPHYWSFICQSAEVSLTWTPFHLAVILNLPHLLEFHIQKENSVVTQRTVDGVLPLELAFRLKHREVVTILQNYITSAAIPDDHFWMANYLPVDEFGSGEHGASEDVVQYGPFINMHSSVAIGLVFVHSGDGPFPAGAIKVLKCMDNPHKSASISSLFERYVCGVVIDDLKPETIVVAELGVSYPNAATTPRGCVPIQGSEQNNHAFYVEYDYLKNCDRFVSGLRAISSPLHEPVGFTYAGAINDVHWAVAYSEFPRMSS